MGPRRDPTRNGRKGHRHHRVGRHWRGRPVPPARTPRPGHGARVRLCARRLGRCGRGRPPRSRPVDLRLGCRTATTLDAPPLVSKDTFLKLWALETQHCIETVVGHRSEAWSFAYDADSNVLISGGGEGEVKCWKVDNEVLLHGISALGGGADADEGARKKLKRAISPIAALSLPNTSHTHNISQITLHPTLPVLAIHSGERAIDVFRLRTEDELRKKLARRRKREREKKEKAKAGKGKGKGKAVDGDEAEEDDEMDGGGAGADGEIEWRDRLAVWSTVRTSGKIRNFSFAPETLKNKGEVQVRLSLSSSMQVGGLRSSANLAGRPAAPRLLVEQRARSVQPPSARIVQSARRRARQDAHPRPPRTPLRCALPRRVV